MIVNDEMGAIDSERVDCEPAPLCEPAPRIVEGIRALCESHPREVEGDASKTTAGSWFANSDARIKTDISSVTGALEKLAQVRPVSFRYTDEYRAAHPSVENRRYLNVVAQEFSEVFPEAIGKAEKVVAMKSARR